MLAKIQFMEKYPDAKNTAKQFHFMGDPALILSKGSGFSHVSGQQPSDRTWGGYTTITEDVTVPYGQTLEIKPYAFVEFENDAKLRVYGTLIASGEVFSTEADIVLYAGAQVTVPGDWTLPSGAELTINPSVVVEFLANHDATGDGEDRTLSELIVEGTLDASAGDITFRSANTNPLPLEWYGLRVASGGHVHLEDVTVRDGVHCVQADPGGSLVLENLTLINCGTPPTIEGNPTPEFPEDRTEPVAAYTAEDAEGDAVEEWSLVAGDDASAFTLDSQINSAGQSAGVLDFEEPPDFETLNGDSLFYVTVRATDSQQAFTDYPVTVTVRNVEEEGSVSVSPLPPEVGKELTATLEDEDGIVTGTTAWTWSSAERADGPWTTVRTGSGKATDSYTPQASDVGRLLQARVRYEDPFGRKEVAGDATEAVQPAKSWQTPHNNGSEITGYEYQYRLAGRTAWEQAWTPIEGSTATTRRHLAVSIPIWRFLNILTPGAL